MTYPLNNKMKLFLDKNEAIKTELIACAHFTQHRSAPLIRSRRAHSIVILKTTIGIGRIRGFFCDRIIKSVGK